VINKVAVLGSGSWGTAFAKVLADAGREVSMWARREELVAAINNGCNSDYLPQIKLPAGITASTDVRTVLRGVDAVVFAVPSQTLAPNLREWSYLLPPAATLVSLAKGVELGTLHRMSEVIALHAPRPLEQVAVLSGPNLAVEIAEEQPTATVIACGEIDRAVALQKACATSYFRPYTNTDVIGCELAGAGKNVIALACGIAAGLGFGFNTAASLITRGLAELTRLGVAIGADPRTFAGLAGLGDLVATCSSPLSRNRTFGEYLGQGLSVAQAQEKGNGQVAEGAKSCSSILALGQRYGVEMPITMVIHHICHNDANPKEMVATLVGRQHKKE
jgi:glycerol-3-phosphate dehydrogenase (NAD(P)+)